jgi:hypothetical protein
VLAGVFFGLSASTTWYYFFMVPIAALFYIPFRIDWKLPRKDLWRLLKLGVAAIGVSLILTLPFLIPYYLATHGGVVDYRDAGESQAFAAALADYVIPPTAHFLWGPTVDRLWRNGPNGLWQSEWQLYLGAVSLLLALAGLFHPRRHVVAALVAMTLGCLVFSFGPGLYITHPPPLDPNTNDVALSSIAAPGRLLRELPGFNNLRGWARLGFLVELSVGLLAAAGLTRILDGTKKRFHTSGATQTGIAVTAMALVIFDFFPRPADMSVVAPRAVDQWLSRQPGNFTFIEYPIPHHGFGGPAIYSTRLTGKRIIMGSSQNPPNLAFWPDLSAFPSPWTLDLLSDWGAKYVIVDENLYRAGTSFWGVYQTWDTMLSAINQSGRLKEVAVLQSVHVYEILNTAQTYSAELLKNSSFEEGSTNSLAGWKAVGKPKLDRTGKYSFGGRTGCRVTEKDFLWSAPVPIEPGDCYRLSANAKAGAKSATLTLQLDWKTKDNVEVDVPSTVRTDTRLAQRWQQLTITARAPTHATYAVVRAQGTNGSMWVDDVSLKKIPADCKPVLFVVPNPASAPAGQVGRAAVTWNSCCSSGGRVTVARNDGAEELFSNGASGLAFLDAIHPGSRYEFRLYSEQGPTLLQTVSLNARESSAAIAADPNPVPGGAGLGRTRISWTTLSKDDAEVRVSKDGEPEQLFARGPNGSIEIDWIATGSSYEFRLYSRDASPRLLAKTIVKR